MHSHTTATLSRNAHIGCWRSRMIVLGVLTTAMGIYVGGIFWFGQALADDMRAGVRQVPAGVLIPDHER
jgi:hypothetical protein